MLRRHGATLSCVSERCGKAEQVGVPRNGNAQFTRTSPRSGTSAQAEI
ncbi:hypothetical protein L083_2997 [Actinoplanes sp. N902-109]|nr:hypothetical protein L083_2997 [Actinoplanes sp. N902-109]